MTLDSTDLFSRSIQPSLSSQSSADQKRPSPTIGGVLSAVLRTDEKIRSQMTPAEQTAVEAVVKNVGTPDEYGSAEEYVLRALPYVRSVYSVVDVIQPGMPTKEEISILMRGRYISV